MASRRIFAGLAASCRPHGSSPVIPVSSLCVLVWLFLSCMLWFFVLASALSGVVWYLWNRSPLGWPFRDLLLAADVGLALVVILELAGRIRRPWRRDRVYRLGCWMALGCLALLFSFHYGLKCFGRTSGYCWVRMVSNQFDRCHFVISRELVRQDTLTRIRRDVNATGGRVVWGVGYTQFAIHTSQSVVIIPLRGFDLVIDKGKLKAGGVSYGSIPDNAWVYVTPVGVSERALLNLYLGPLPPGAYRALEEQLRHRLAGDGSD